MDSRDFLWLFRKEVSGAELWKRGRASSGSAWRGRGDDIIRRLGVTAVCSGMGKGAANRCSERNVALFGTGCALTLASNWVGDAGRRTGLGSARVCLDREPLPSGGCSRALIENAAELAAYIREQRVEARAGCADRTDDR